MRGFTLAAKDRRIPLSWLRVADWAEPTIGTTMRVEIQNDPVFLDLIPHFLGIATHDNIDAPPTGRRIASYGDRRRSSAAREALSD